MRKRILLVGPTTSNYANKSLVDRQRIEEYILDKQSQLSQIFDCTLCAFAEDFVLLNVLYGKEIEWLSVTSKSDENFLRTFVTDYPKEKFIRIDKSKWMAEIVESGRKFKLAKSDGTTASEYQLSNERINTINKRIRYAAGLVTMGFDIVVSISYGADIFTTKLKPAIGDGKLLIMVDIKNSSREFFYGGAPISQNDLNQILGVGSDVELNLQF